MAYRNQQHLRGAVTGVIVAGLIGGGLTAVGVGSQWKSAGQDIQNTRYQSTESRINAGTVGQLAVAWAFTTAGDVSATPAVDGANVYAPDWAGYLYAVDRTTGAQVWKAKISDATGIPGDKARATPAISGDKVIVGTQGNVYAGPFGGPGGKLLAYDKSTGALVWSTTLDSHPAAVVTQSATVHGGRVYVGVASLEEGLAGLIPGYVCCSFRGSMLALDVETGAILWKTYMTPAADGFSGNAIWGSSPAIDTRRGQVYIATGNNYSVPDSVLACVAAAGADPTAQAACLPADNHFDSIMALDLATGAIRWATRAIPYDAWTVSCILGDGSNCPSPAGPDYDFGQAPALFTVTVGPKGQRQDFVGAGQKSGQYWVVNPDTGAVVWVTQAGPGGTAGGLQWGSAVDGKRVYTANANYDQRPWIMPDGSEVKGGVWSGLDAVTGQVLWQTAPPHGGSSSGPVTTANGVVFGCTIDSSWFLTQNDPGYMYALDAATGEVLWKFASGGSCLSGAAISNGTVYWGSGYGNFGFGGTPNNKLYAFTISR